MSDLDQVLYPDIMVALTGGEGNAFHILGAVIDAMKRQGISQEAIDIFHAEATSGDYDHLLQTVMRTVEVV